VNVAIYRARKSAELQNYRDHLVKTYRTDRQIESLLMPALALISMLNELALAGSAKARRSLFGLVSIGNQLVEKLNAVSSK
jgi:hypothetical protein